MNINTKLILELDQNEAQTLINLINDCVKAKGLDVAESGLFFVKKIQQSYAKAVESVDESILVGENL